jgi:hypothetical protein
VWVLEDHKVLHLHGLRQVPRAWNTKLDATLRTLCFTSSASEHYVFARGRGSSRLLLGIYFDDLIVTGTNPDEVHRFKGEMTERFRMSDLGLLCFYLGIEVKQGEACISICKVSYADKLLASAGMVNCTSTTMPMERRLKLSKSSMHDLVDALLYRSMVGGLR